jgi:membrane protease YdiL (CAAX protease family)
MMHHVDGLMQRGFKQGLLATALSLSLLLSLFFAMLIMSVIIQMLFGRERFTFGNEFFIQAAAFTIVIAEAVWIARLFEFAKKDSSELLSLRPAGLAEILLASGAAVALTLPLSHFDNLLQTLMPPDELERQLMMAAYHPGSAVERIFVILSLVAAAPVGEELLFRGAMMTWIRDGSRWWAALIVTSIFFGLSHLMIPRTIILIFPVGLLFGWIVLRTGSIFPSIAAHAAFNGFPLVAYWSGLRIRGYNTVGQDPVGLPALMWIGGGVAAAICLYVLETVIRKRKPESHE